MDVPEFIRNVNFGEDIVNRLTKGRKYKGNKEKVTQRIGQFGSCINGLMRGETSGCDFGSDGEE